MAILKCKMCGGDLVVTPGVTVCECEYCGSRQTVPSVDDEKKLTLFARANRLRAACEFDKAFGVYESIVADFPEEAEAYWGLLLCRYGIEYVDDPKTGRKIPTCHRSSFTSILEDPDFELVMENSDPASRTVYREEAKTIEALRVAINEVSAKEDPYDIFICYKETDALGQRTVDSVIAQDVYNALTEKGYRVFFSRISLEDKLGQEYEPYIFAALQSARIMLAFGTDYEYYNAVWVKNEWSRFLGLIEKGAKKTLIPCFKDIDAYDMPAEFRRLQAQDMGKVGAMQDLLRGIEKILPKHAQQEPDPGQMTEKEKRRGGPDLIQMIKMIGTNDKSEYWPNGASKATFDRKDYEYIAVQIILRNEFGHDTLPYGFIIYDSLDNQVFTFSNTLSVTPTNDRVSVIWSLRKDGKYLYDVGQYHVEAWAYDSRVAEYNFSFVDAAKNQPVQQPMEKTRRQLAQEERRGGPDRIRSIFTAGAANRDDVFPKNALSSRIDLARFSFMSMQMSLRAPIGYTGTAQYNFTIYDSYENVMLDSTSNIQVIPTYDKFGLVWILRGDDGSTVAPGEYTIDAWINDSRISSYRFTIIDSSVPYMSDVRQPLPQTPQPTQTEVQLNQTLQALELRRTYLEQMIRETKGLFSGRKRKNLEEELRAVNGQIAAIRRQ